jgi:IclR family acetate operon transcriptional repressor
LIFIAFAPESAAIRCGTINSWTGGGSNNIRINGSIFVYAQDRNWMAEGRSASPLAVSRLFQIVQHLACAGGGASLTELAGALDAPATSLLGLLRGLVDQGYVGRDGRTYKLGPESYLLAGRILGGRNVGQIARPALAALSQATGETSGLSLLSSDRKEMTYTEFVSGSNPIRYEPVIGERHNLHTGAGGRLMLALFPAEETERYLAGVRLAKSTANTVTDMAVLREVIATARRDRFTATFGENVAGAAAFGAPVFDQSEKPLGVVLLIGPVERMRSSREAFERLVRDAGREISRRLGSQSTGAGAETA